MPYALATEYGAAASTIVTYTDDLTCYFAWLEAQQLRLNEVTVERLRDYIKSLDERDYVNMTAARRMTMV